MSSNQDFGVSSSSSTERHWGGQASSSKSLSKGAFSFGSFLSQAASSSSFSFESVCSALTLDVSDETSSKANAKSSSSKDSSSSSSFSSLFAGEPSVDKTRVDEESKPKVNDRETQDESSEESQSQDDDSSEDDEKVPKDDESSSNSALLLLQRQMALPVQSESVQAPPLPAQDSTVALTDVPSVQGVQGVQDVKGVEVVPQAPAEAPGASLPASSSAASSVKASAQDALASTATQPPVPQTEQPAPQSSTVVVDGNEPALSQKSASASKQAQGQDLQASASSSSPQAIASQASDAAAQAPSSSSSATANAQAQSSQQSFLSGDSASQSAASSSNSASSSDSGFQSGTSQIKVQSVSYDSLSNASQQVSSQSQAGVQSDLMMNLMSRQSSFAVAAGRVYASQSSSVSETASSASVKPEALSLSGVADLAAKSAPLQARTSDGGFFDGSSGEEKGFDGHMHFGAQTKGEELQAQTAKTQSSLPTSSSGQAAVNAVQEICSKMNSALRGSSLDGQKSFSMELEVSGLGGLKVSLMQSDGKISVTLQASSESGKEQLMSQRDELASEMKNLGYKDVAIDVRTGSDNGSNDNWRRHGSGSGNAESQENVKLSGNDSADLSEILSMNI